MDGSVTVIYRLLEGREGIIIVMVIFLITTSLGPGFGFAAFWILNGYSAGVVIHAAVFSVILRTLVQSEIDTWDSWIMKKKYGRLKNFLNQGRMLVFLYFLL